MKIKLNNVSKTIKNQKILDNINAEFEGGKADGSRCKKLYKKIKGQKCS